MADEYVIVNKTDLASMADTMRDALGSTDSIAVSNFATALIESIEAGGGGKIAKLTYVAASDTVLSARLTHSLGELPNFVAFYTTTSISDLPKSKTLKFIIYYNGDTSLQTNDDQLCVGGYKNSTTSTSASLRQRVSDALNGSYSDSAIYGVTEDDIFVSPYGLYGSTCYFAEGIEYKCCVAVIK